MNIVVASGKGGTGKTTIATSLAYLLHQRAQSPVRVLDCDVEAPNAHLILKPNFEQTQDAVISMPFFSENLCTQCKICVEVCRYHAIIMLGKMPTVLSQLCHGCGNCTLQCPSEAISEIPHAIGQLSAGATAQGLLFAQGELRISEPMASPVIRQLKQWQVDPDEINILDAPPGASCPVVETLRHANFALLVTEPTPFGLHDLKQMVQLVRQMNIPHDIILNRSTLGDGKVASYCTENEINILMHIPFEKTYAEKLASGKLLLDVAPQLEGQFWQVFQYIKKIVSTRGANHDQDH